MKTGFKVFCGGIFTIIWGLSAPVFAQHDHYGSPAGTTAPHSAIEGVEISDAWVRLNEMTGRPSAGYFSLRNNTDTKLTLRGVGVAAPAAPDARAMFHQTTEIDGRMKMSHVAVVGVKPGTDVKFAPGGLHIMLHHLPADLVVGGVLQLDILVQSGADEAVPVRVPFKLCGLAAATLC